MYLEVLFVSAAIERRRIVFVLGMVFFCYAISKAEITNILGRRLVFAKQHEEVSNLVMLKCIFRLAYWIRKQARGEFVADLLC